MPGKSAFISTNICIHFTLLLQSNQYTFKPTQKVYTAGCDRIKLSTRENKSKIVKLN